VKLCHINCSGPVFLRHTVHIMSVSICVTHWTFCCGNGNLLILLLSALLSLLQH